MTCRSTELAALSGQGLRPVEIACECRSKEELLGRSADALLTESRPTDFDRIFTDKIIGTRDDLPGLATLLDYARDGDTVVVVALDRLGRSLAGIVRTVETLRERGVMLRSLRRARPNRCESPLPGLDAVVGRWAGLCCLRSELPARGHAACPGRSETGSQVFARNRCRGRSRSRMDGYDQRR